MKAFEDNPPKSLVRKIWLRRGKFLKTYNEDINPILNNSGYTVIGWGNFKQWAEGDFPEWVPLEGIQPRLEGVIDVGREYTNLILARRNPDFNPSIFDSLGLDLETRVS
jgi:hypothetical protein